MFRLLTQRTFRHISKLYPTGTMSISSTHTTATARSFSPPFEALEEGSRVDPISIDDDDDDIVRPSSKPATPPAADVKLSSKAVTPLVADVQQRTAAALNPGEQEIAPKSTLLFSAAAAGQSPLKGKRKASVLQQITTKQPATKSSPNTKTTTISATSTSHMPQGFRLIEDFITVEEEKSLFDQLDAEPWTVDFTRKLQYYNYRNERTAPYSLVPFKYQTPAFLEPVLNRLVTDGVVREKPDQLIINNYLPGEGIRPHHDRKDYFKDQICAINLMSGCTLQLMTPVGRFSKPVPKESRELFEVYIPRRSAYLMEGNARFNYHHAIAGKKSDTVNGQKVLRERRVSITGRNVILNKVKRHNIDTFED